MSKKLNRISMSDVQPTLKRGNPRCHECTEPAEIVCVNPKWGCYEFEDGDKRAIFCCRKHVDQTHYWYWFWIIPADQRDDRAPTLHDFNFLCHLAEKTWGPDFIHWLLSSKELRRFDRKTK